MTAKRARAEEELRNSHANLSALLDNTDDYILVSDKKGFPVMFNSAYARIMKEALGIEMKPGLKPHKLLPDKKAVAWWDNLHRRVLSGEKFREVYTHDFGKGDIRHLEVSYCPIIRDGEVNGFVEITRDTTECKRVEGEFKKSEELLKNILNILPVRVFWKDAESRYLGCNELFAKDAGLPIDEIVGKNDFDLTWKKHATLYRNDDKKVTESGISKLSYEEPTTKPTGDTIWLSTSKVPLKDSG